MININSYPDGCTLITDDKKETVFGYGDKWGYRDFMLTIKDGVIRITAEKTPIKTVFLRWNCEMEPNLRFLGDAFERGYGKLSFQGYTFNRIMPWYFIATDGEKNYGCGVKTNSDACVFWETDAQGITMVIDTRCGGDGVVLDGKVITAGELVYAENTGDCFDFACDYCKLMCDNPLLPKAPVYGSNNWYYAYGKSSYMDIMRDTRILSDLTEVNENRPYMVIDDCWQPLARTTGAAGRPIHCGNEFFPDMQALAYDMKVYDVKPGIWFRPIRTHEKFLPQELISDRDKECFDLTNPDALELIAEDTRRLVDWGYELIKYDFVTYDVYGTFGSHDINFLQTKSGWHWHDRSVTNAVAIKNLYDVIHENAGDAVLIGCNAIGHLAAGKIHIHRSGDDTSGRNWYTTLHKGVNTLAFRLPQNKAFFNIDADCVGATEKVPWKMNRLFLDLVAKSGSPLFCSIKPSAFDDDMCDDMFIAYRTNSKQQNSIKPLDWTNNTTPRKWLIDGEECEYDWIEQNGETDFIL